MTQWEYLFLEMPTTGGPFMPDEYGRQGWELVAVLPASPTIDRLWFKRPKPEVWSRRKRSRENANEPSRFARALGVVKGINKSRLASP